MRAHLLRRKAASDIHWPGLLEGIENLCCAWIGCRRKKQKEEERFDEDEEREGGRRRREGGRRRGGGGDNVQVE